MSRLEAFGSMSNLCVKCQQGTKLSGDSWCLGCAGWESIERELSSRWPAPSGLRVIAEDLVLSAARGVRALRAVGAGFAAAPASSRAEPLPAAEVPKSGPAHPGLAAKSQPAKPKQSEEESVYTYETDTEEEESPEKEVARSSKEKKEAPKASERKAEKGKDSKRVKEERRSEDRKESRRKDSKPEDKELKRHRGESSKKDHRDHRGEGDHKRKHKKTRRGGRKHKRLDRLKERPFTEVHRSLSDFVLKERPLLTGRQQKWGRGQRWTLSKKSHQGNGFQWPKEQW